MELRGASNLFLLAVELDGGSATPVRNRSRAYQGDLFGKIPGTMMERVGKSWLHSARTSGPLGDLVPRRGPLSPLG